MRAIELHGFGIEGLQVVDRPVPAPGPGEILLRMRAASINYRDLAIVEGRYRPDMKPPIVPVSDGCGTVEALGDGVTGFAAGDRVIPVYVQGWIDGDPTPEQRSQRTLGFPLPGILQQYVVIPAAEVIAAPANLSDEEAATLPIAALTAWAALERGGLQTGDWVLVEGTGGVAIFALQFAKLAGARVVALSSSDEKLRRVVELGADVTINYRTTPEWSGAVLAATGSTGVDIALETTGGTLATTIAATRFGGFIALIGFVGGHMAEIDVRQLLAKMVTLRGSAVGSRRQFEAMNRAIAMHGLKPQIDSVYPFEQANAAFAKMKAGAHFGKIVLTFP